MAFHASLPALAYSYLIRDTRPFGRVYPPKPTHKMDTVKVTADYAEPLVISATSALRPRGLPEANSSIARNAKQPSLAANSQNLMHVRKHLGFTACAAGALSASMIKPFPADGPFFRRGIPAIKTDFQDRDSHVCGLRTVRLIQSSPRVPFGIRPKVRQRQTGNSLAATADCQSANHGQSSKGRARVPIS